MIEKNGNVTLAEYKKAYREIKAHEQKIDFLINFAAYMIVNSLLITINLLFVPSIKWFIFPLIGWGAGLTLHYIFAVRLINRSFDIEEAKVEHLVESRGE